MLIRYVTNDIPLFASRAKRLIESSTPLGITTVALHEATHVLRNPPYSYPRELIVDALVELIRRANIQGVGVDTADASVALLLCRASGSVSYGDALLAATGRSAGVLEAYSFDDRFGRPGLRLVEVPD